MANSLAGRLILGLTLCSVLIIGLALGLDYRLSRDEILERVRLESRDSIGATITSIDNWLESVQNSTDFLGRILEQRDYSLQGLNDLVKDLVWHNDDIVGATIALAPDQVDAERGFAPYYFRRDGLLLEADLTAGEALYWERPWFADAVAAGKPVWVEPYFDTSGAQVLMTTYSVPVYRATEDGTRKLYAVATADVALSELQHYLDRLRLGESGFGVLLSRAGVMLASPIDADIMRHHSDIIGDEIDANSWQQMLDAALAGDTTTREVNCRAVQGDCVIRLSALNSTGWPVGVVYATEEILAPLRQYQYRASLAGIIAILLMILAVTWIARRMTNPLVALVRASDRIAKGDLDAPLPPPAGNDEVARLVHSFGAMKRDLKQYINDLEAAAATRARLDGELSAAREIQMAMLPQGGEALEEDWHFHLWAKVRPAKSVGGDLYSYALIDRRKLIFCLGDVSDKGVPAALFMARAISLIQLHPEAFDSPGTGLMLLNNALEHGNDNCMFLTLFCGTLDLDSGALTYASAGHTPPLLCRELDIAPLPTEAGPALGLGADLHYPDNRVTLQRGDRLAVYTDGIDEAFNPEGEQFGHGRLKAELAAAGDRLLDVAGRHVFDAVDQFSAGEPQSDDISLLLLELPAPAASRELDLEPGAELFASASSWLNEALTDLLPDSEDGNLLLLVLEEALTNIDKYAALPAGERIGIRLDLRAQDIALELRDRGTPFNPLTQARRARLGADTATAEIGGLGVHLITQLTDSQHYRFEDGYNRLRLSIKRAQPAVIEAREPLQHKEQSGMKLTTSVAIDEANSVARVHLDGALNTDTAPDFEAVLQDVVDKSYRLTVLDMAGLDYISSAGLRVIFKAAKQTKSAGNRLAAANRKPHIDKVFEILKALPDMAVFANEEELDDYLHSMQEQVKGD